MSSSSASNKNTHDKTMAQYNADARLTAEFEKSGKFFNYSKSVRYEPKTPSSDDQMTAYLTKIQRGGLVQSFGCMLAIGEPTCKIIGYSENCVDMLGLKNLDEAKDCMSLIGIDARTLFTPSSRASLNEAFESREMSLSNPIWLHSWTSSRPFYAILHRIDVGIVIDLEPAPFGDPVTIHAGVVQSQKLAVKAISRLQSLPGGDIGILCDAVVEDVQRLTGYDRVMAYKFHDDDHGEVISEIRRSDLEPYLGLHYPATDIPQAARFLFRQNRVRMICDCKCQPVKVIQSEELKQPLCLVNSTLRSPHGCHAQYMANMGSISSLVFAVIVNNGDSMKLWGLVVCHHTSPRYVPFPLRYACEFLIQTFSLQLHMELQIASQLAEKKILRVQTSLSDMILHDTPLGVMTRSPNIMDLVKCDGAALYYGRKFWLLGVTPTESQLQNIVEWLLKILGDSMGLSTDSLVDAGYPGATFLGDAVCGMVTARITSSDFLFWFRSHTAIEFGAKHHTEDKDDGGKMHPRSSFNAFLEVVKSRSRPWEALEINAIHSLQLIMRDSLQEIEEKGHKYNPKQLTMRDSLQEIEESGHKPDDARVDESGHKPNVCDDARVAERTSVAVEMARLIETATAPIFGVSLLGLINGWNAKMCELTGLEVSDALGKSLIDIVHEDSREVAKTLIVRGIQGTEDKNVEVKLLKFDAHSPHTLVYLLVNTCTSRDYKNDVVGVCFVGQDITGEKTVMNKFIRLHWDYKAIIQSVNPFIPPIFASDDNACCSEWNAVMENLTGYMKHEIIGKMLAGEIFGGFCKLKDPEILTKFMILLYRAIGGHNTEKLAFGFFNRKGEFVEVNLTASKRSDEKGSIIGCLCLLQTVVINHKESIVNKQEERKQVSKELAYIMRETKNSLDGIRFTHQILRGSAISDDQKRYLDTSDACERQILSIIDDGYFGSFEVGNGSLKVEEFLLGNLVNAIICQAMLLSRKNNLHFIQDIPEQIKTLYVYGDQMKLQLALSDLLLSVVDNAPTPDGWVEIKVSLGLKFIQDGNEYVHIEFRMVHSGNGLPLPVIEDMFDVTNHWKTHEGFALNISQKLVNMMKGNVRYIREQNRYYFQIELELKSRAKSILLPDRT